MEENNNTPKPRVIGKPFEKNDPRINRKGPPVVSDIKKYIKERMAEPAREARPNEDPKAVPTRIHAIFSKLLQMAFDGNIKAMELLLKYGYGNPAQMIEIMGKDGSPLQSIPMVAWVGEKPAPQLQQSPEGDDLQTDQGEHEPEPQ
jgi:hypothetical protein